jgi:hypothetical protein
MKLSSFVALVRNIGLAIVSILLSIEFIIAYPLPTIAQTPPTPSVTVTPTPIPQAPITKTDPQNPPAQPAPKQEQTKSGGPYDLKAIQESYKSLYGS